MFLKPYKLKSNAPLKGSDAKKLKQRIEKSFPNATSEQILTLLPPKGNVTQLKLVTYRDFQTNVYCVDKLPLFFEIDEKGTLCPTLYAMWHVQDLLPYFTTHAGVLPKLSNGADLMLPGVVTQGTGMNIYGRYKKDQLVAVNLSSNRSAVGVGILPRSSDDMYMSGGHGVAVQMLHLFGDKLWGHDPALAQQVPNKKQAALTSEDFPALGAETHKIKAATAVTNLLREQQPNAEQTVELPHVENLQIINEQQSEEDCNAEIEKAEINANVDAPNEETPDVILKNAFLAALKNHGKSLQLPLLTSNFYRLYVVPEAAQQIDLKKTKYKKLSNFLNEMIDQGFIVVREENKGVDKITSIDFEHPELVNFITDFKKPNTDGESADQPLFHSELVEMYIVSDATVAFFTKMNYKRGEGIPSGQIKKIVREYISKNNLPMHNPLVKEIQLDDTLKSLCNNAAAATLSNIVNSISSQMDHSYQMCTVKDVSSNKPLIQMSLATRSGNKKVTLVSNIECYGIILSEFIKLCKQGAAASTTIVKLPNQKREQLQIQGNQVRFIYTLLTETYKVSPKCILGLELAKDGKKHKKK